MSKRIALECKPDEKLAKAIGFVSNQIAHQSCKGDVCNYISKNNVQLALIDEDPDSSQPKYLKDFTVVDDKHQVRKLRNKHQNKTIYVLKPRLEEWILSRCAASGINIEDYHLPSNNKRLKDKINYGLPHFENLLQALLERKDAGLMYLKNETQTFRNN